MRSTASCSRGDVTTRPAFDLVSAIAMASLAPDVKITCPSQPSELAKNVDTNIITQGYVMARIAIRYCAY